MPVETGDVLQLPELSEWKLVPVEWRQKMMSYKKNYYKVDFINTRADDTDKVAVLFVSEEKLEDFKSIKMQSTDSGPRMTVDNDFVYGQQKDGNHRFLVFHDTNRAMFQHRFVEGTLTVMSRHATDFASKWGYGNLNVLPEMAAGSIGDYLHEFR